MIARTMVSLGRASALFFVCLALDATGWSVQASDINLEARLIWGTNDETTPDPKYKKLDTALTKWLSKKLKWKHFFEINRKSDFIPLSATKKFRMSDRCELEVKNLGDSRIEVKFFGAGKPVNKMTHTLPKDDWLIIAGDDKNDTAWFVVLKVGSPK